MPHIIPCPAPRIKYTEGDYEITEDGRRRRRRRSEDIKEPGLDGPGEDQFPLRSGEDEENLTQKTAHECPVPKPKGLIGQVLGFKKDAVDEKIPRPRVETGAKTKSRRGDS